MNENVGSMDGLTTVMSSWYVVLIGSQYGLAAPPSGSMASLRPAVRAEPGDFPAPPDRCSPGPPSVPLARGNPGANSRALENVANQVLQLRRQQPLRQRQDPRIRFATRQEEGQAILALRVVSGMVSGLGELIVD
jgi:hypothetical protein